MARIAPGDRVRLVLVWQDKDRTGGCDVQVEGTVAEHTDLGDGSGALLLTDVPEHLRGYWCAPSSDEHQTTTVEVLAGEPVYR
ncbi:hypothetical protein MOQ72_43740 [Saccharopolyspora sp. K220]|uniref:hypothetical protein n=1 Tax=Saccharopolyspora soli TaxID=2926618 RepID=UPI001F5A8482|nr:hypothetical protein [Saccharopolyspora soli]MCI2424325.1 hypothetical protein [Saccharopolyspora soli]